jgi:hypothetical protein
MRFIIYRAIARTMIQQDLVMDPSVGACESGRMAGNCQDAA